MRLRSSLSAAAVAAAIASATPAHAGGTLTVAQTRDPNNWDPIATYLIAWGQVASNVFDGLVMRDEQLKLKPDLATSWEVLDQGMRLRFHLRQGVTFHDGEPFNADAVK